MSANECFVYTMILINADPSSGIWEGSAGLLAELYNVPRRTCREALENLEKDRYLKRFPVRGKHGSYPILVHQFECSDGAMKGMRLNAMDSLFYDNPIYESCHEDVNEYGNEHGDESAAKYLENREERKEPSREKKSRGTKTAEAKSRHADFKEAIQRYWASRNPGIEMPWGPAEGRNLEMWLRQSPQTTLEQFVGFLRNRYRSEVTHTDRPSKWISGVTSFATGPLDRFGKPLNFQEPKSTEPTAYEKARAAELAEMQERKKQQGVDYAG